jgi:hypothetical protein
MGPRLAVDGSEVVQSSDQMKICQIKFGAARIGTKVFKYRSSRKKLCLSVPSDPLNLAVCSVRPKPRCTQD